MLLSPGNSLQQKEIYLSPSYWLMKSEPDTFSLHDLEREGTTLWTGVRNYQARNFMRDQMQPGHEVLFYHSNAHPPGLAGLARVVSTGHVDPLQFDPQSPYYDPKSDPHNPRWICAKIAFVAHFKVEISLLAIKNHPQSKNLLLTQKGSRLSIQPVQANDFIWLKNWGLELA